MKINYNSEPNLSEYKIGNTTYVVTIKFNKSGENLENIISRLIARDIEEAAWEYGLLQQIVILYMYHSPLLFVGKWG